MSIFIILETALVQEPGNRSSLLEALRTIGRCDADNSGKNGDEYKWEEACFHETNLDYLIGTVANIEDDEECVSAFFEEWMKHDGYYYKEPTVKLVKNEDGNVLVISFAAYD